ncbi:DsbA family protein [Escherichia coli]
MRLFRNLSIQQNNQPWWSSSPPCFAFPQQYGIDKGIRDVFEKAGVSDEEHDRMMDNILVKAKAAEMRQLFRDYKVIGTPTVFVNGHHINNSAFHGETPEAYRREYVDAMEKLLKASE